MRLVCPNCSARYEVPENVIPKNGRDVECSSCGHTWFENHPGKATATPSVTPVPPLSAPNEDDELQAALNDPLPEPTRPAANKAKIDPALSEVLKEEVAREMQARKGNTLESQPELGLEDNFAALPSVAPTRPKAPSSTDDELHELETLYKQGIKDIPAKRRELLPDIEEINSTLTSTRSRTEHRSYETSLPQDQRKPRRFRGFVFGLLIIAIATALYVYAGEFGQAMPAAQPYLDAYVTQVDYARAWLDTVTQNAILWLESQAAKARQG